MEGSFTNVWRCALPSCHALRFLTMQDLKTHHDKHFSVLSSEWKEETGCPWPKCRSQKRSTVFQNKTAFRKHLRTHFKSLWCEHPGCTYDRPFRSRSDVNRHMQSKHVHTQSFTCNFPSCSSAFTRKDKLDLHTRKEHPSSSCAMDHYGRIVLDVDRDDHFNTFHNGRPLEHRSHKASWSGESGIVECALPGCESTISRFNPSSARRHLNTNHGIDLNTAGTLLSHFRWIEGFPESCPESLMMRKENNFTRSKRYRRCNICARKKATAGEIQPDATVNNSVRPRQFTQSIQDH